MKYYIPFYGIHNINYWKIEIGSICYMYANSIRFNSLIMRWYNLSEVLNSYIDCYIVEITELDTHLEVSNIFDPNKVKKLRLLL